MEGSRVAILGYGSIVQECLGAAEMLKSYNVATTVADARFCKPLDTELIRRLAKEHEILITVEEGSIGGFGSHVSHFLSLNGILDGNLKVMNSLLMRFVVGSVVVLMLINVVGFDVIAYLNEMQLRSMVLPDRYIEHGAAQDQIEAAGLSSTHISGTVLSLLGRPLEALKLQ